jgi:dihydropteroate synthase
MNSPFALRLWQLAHGRSLELGPTGRLMAIINVTPDSFSDGGRFAGLDDVLAACKSAIDAGADILDIGGESTRPGAAEVTASEEQDRVLPVIEALAARLPTILSIDTYRAETADLAVAAGAHIINDVHGLQREPAIADVAARHRAGLCIMHTGRGRLKAADVIEDQRKFFETSLAIAQTAGNQAAQIVLDPGFGFNKETVEENTDLLARFAELHELGYPLLVGTSRKRFLGTLTGRDATGRDVATAATTALMRRAGAAVFRVHHVAINRDALMVADAIVKADRVIGEEGNP